jgi:hypothetical protein
VGHPSSKIDFDPVYLVAHPSPKHAAPQTDHAAASPVDNNTFERSSVIDFAPARIVVARPHAGAKEEDASPAARATFISPPREGTAGTNNAPGNPPPTASDRGKSLAPSRETNIPGSTYRPGRRNPADGPFDDHIEGGRLPSFVYPENSSKGDRGGRKAGKQKGRKAKLTTGEMTVAPIPPAQSQLLQKDKEILEGLRKIRDRLYRQYEKDGENLDPRKKSALVRLKYFLPDFEDKLEKMRRNRTRPDRKFRIAYDALKALVDPDNYKIYGRDAPFKKVNQFGDTSSKGTAVNHCNQFVFDVVEKVTGRRLAASRLTEYGMLGAGVYFEDESAPFLSEIRDDGEMGDIISFGPKDSEHPESGNNSPFAHVGIYLGDGLYVSATDGGYAPFDQVSSEGTSSVGVADRISIADVYYHPHFREVK